MTEFEINKKVAEKLNIPHYVIKGKVLNSGDDSVYDPCNNPAQAWDIMIKHDTSVTKYGQNFIALSSLGSRYDYFDTENLCCESEIVINEKPFVAAMLLFLEI